MDHGSGGGSGSGSRHRLQHQELEYNAGAGTPGIPVEVAIGAAVGTGLVVVAMTVFTAIVCVIRRRRHFRHHSYYVRDYHQTPAMSNNNSSAGKSAKKNASSNSINGGRASKKRSSAAKNRTQIGFSRHGGSGGGAVGDHGLRRNTIGSSRLPACLRASHDAEVSAADDDDDDGDKDDVDGATEVRGRYGYGLRQDSSDMEKFVSTTLQSLLEDKDATVAPTSIGERQDGDVVKSNEIHHHLADELQLKDIVDNGRINDAADAEALGVDDDCSSALNRIGNRSPRHLATDAALSELADDQSECFETKKEAMVAAAEPPVAVSEADGKQNPTPDLLQDGGCGGDQLRSLFRRGGSTARSPCRRTSSRSSSSSTTGAKVSFAIDCYKDDKESNDDETSAILIPASAAGTRGSSLSGFAAARYRAEENQYVKRIPGLETINTCGPSSFGYGHGRPTVNAIPLTPTSSCSTAAAMLLDTPESSNSGCSGYCVARTGSLGRRVRPSATTTSFDGSCTADVAARHMTLPGSYCSYAATSSSSGGGNSRGSRSATSATGSSSKPPLPLIAQLEKTFTIALPSTIVGVTEGLFMPPSSHCQLAQMATSSGSSTLPPPAPRKPSRAYEWQATAAGGCSASGVSAVSDAVGDLTSTGQINATTVPSSFKPTTKRVQLQPPPPSSSASSSSSASTQPRKNSFGTAV